MIEGVDLWIVLVVIGWAIFVIFGVAFSPLLISLPYEFDPPLKTNGFLYGGSIIARYFGAIVGCIVAFLIGAVITVVSSVANVFLGVFINPTKYVKVAVVLLAVYGMNTYDAEIEQGISNAYSGYIYVGWNSAVRPVLGGLADIGAGAIIWANAGYRVRNIMVYEGVNRMYECTLDGSVQWSPTVTGAFSVLKEAGLAIANWILGGLVATDVDVSATMRATSSFLLTLEDKTTCLCRDSQYLVPLALVPLNSSLLNTAVTSAVNGSWYIPRQVFSFMFSLLDSLHYRRRSVFEGLDVTPIFDNYRIAVTALGGWCDQTVQYVYGQLIDDTGIESDFPATIPTPFCFLSNALLVILDCVETVIQMLLHLDVLFNFNGLDGYFLQNVIGVGSSDPSSAYLPIILSDAYAACNCVSTVLTEIYSPIGGMFSAIVRIVIDAVTFIINFITVLSKEGRDWNQVAAFLVNYDYAPLRGDVADFGGAAGDLVAPVYAPLGYLIFTTIEFASQLAWVAYNAIDHVPDAISLQSASYYTGGNFSALCGSALDSYDFAVDSFGVVISGLGQFTSYGFQYERSIRAEGEKKSKVSSIAHELRIARGEVEVGNVKRESIPTTTQQYDNAMVYCTAGCNIWCDTLFSQSDDYTASVCYYGSQPGAAYPGTGCIAACYRNCDFNTSLCVTHECQAIYAGACITAFRPQATNDSVSVGCATSPPLAETVCQGGNPFCCGGGLVSSLLRILSGLLRFYGKVLMAIVNRDATAVPSVNVFANPVRDSLGYAVCLLSRAYVSIAHPSEQYYVPIGLCPVTKSVCVLADAADIIISLLTHATTLFDTSGGGYFITDVLAVTLPNLVNDFASMVSCYGSLFQSLTKFVRYIISIINLGAALIQLLIEIVVKIISIAKSNQGPVAFLDFLQQLLDGDPPQLINVRSALENCFAAYVEVSLGTYPPAAAFAYDSLFAIEQVSWTALSVAINAPDLFYPSLNMSGYFDANGGINQDIALSYKRLDNVISSAGGILSGLETIALIFTDVEPFKRTMEPPPNSKGLSFPLYSVGYPVLRGWKDDRRNHQQKQLHQQLNLPKTPPQKQQTASIATPSSKLRGFEIVRMEKRHGTAYTTPFTQPEPTLDIDLDTTTFEYYESILTPPNGVNFSDASCVASCNTHCNSRILLHTAYNLNYFKPGACFAVVNVTVVDFMVNNHPSDIVSAVVGGCYGACIVAPHIVGPPYEPTNPPTVAPVRTTAPPTTRSPTVAAVSFSPNTAVFGKVDVITTTERPTLAAFTDSACTTQCATTCSIAFVADYAYPVSISGNYVNGNACLGTLQVNEILPDLYFVTLHGCYATCVVTVDVVDTTYTYMPGDTQATTTTEQSTTDDPFDTTGDDSTTTIPTHPPMVIVEESTLYFNQTATLFDEDYERVYVLGNAVCVGVCNSLCYTNYASGNEYSAGDLTSTCFGVIHAREEFIYPHLFFEADINGCYGTCEDECRAPCGPCVTDACSYMCATSCLTSVMPLPRTELLQECTSEDTNAAQVQCTGKILCCAAGTVSSFFRILLRLQEFLINILVSIVQGAPSSTVRDFDRITTPIRETYSYFVCVTSRLWQIIFVLSDHPLSDYTYSPSIACIQETVGCILTSILELADNCLVNIVSIVESPTYFRTRIMGIGPKFKSTPNPAAPVRVLVASIDGGIACVKKQLTYVYSPFATITGGILDAANAVMRIIPRVVVELTAPSTDLHSFQGFLGFYDFENLNQYVLDIFAGISQIANDIYAPLKPLVYNLGVTVDDAFELVFGIALNLENLFTGDHYLANGVVGFNQPYYAPGTLTAMFSDLRQNLYDIKSITDLVWEPASLAFFDLANVAVSVVKIPFTLVLILVGDSTHFLDFCQVYNFENLLLYAQRFSTSFGLMFEPIHPCAPNIVTYSVRSLSDAVGVGLTTLVNLPVLFEGSAPKFTTYVAANITVMLKDIGNLGASLSAGIQFMNGTSTRDCGSGINTIYSRSAPFDMSESWSSLRKRLSENIWARKEAEKNDESFAERDFADARAAIYAKTAAAHVRKAQDIANSRHSFRTVYPTQWYCKKNDLGVCSTCMSVAAPYVFRGFANLSMCLADCQGSQDTYPACPSTAYPVTKVPVISSSCSSSSSVGYAIPCAMGFALNATVYVATTVVGYVVTFVSQLIEGVHVPVLNGVIASLETLADAIASLSDVFLVNVPHNNLFATIVEKLLDLLIVPVSFLNQIITVSNGGTSPFQDLYSFIRVFSDPIFDLLTAIAAWADAFLGIDTLETIVSTAKTLVDVFLQSVITFVIDLVNLVVDILGAIGIGGDNTSGHSYASKIPDDFGAVLKDFGDISLTLLEALLGIIFPGFATHIEDFINEVAGFFDEFATCVEGFDQFLMCLNIPTTAINCFGDFGNCILCELHLGGHHCGDYKREMSETFTSSGRILKTRAFIGHKMSPAYVGAARARTMGTESSDTTTEGATPYTYDVDEWVYPINGSAPWRFVVPSIDFLQLRANSTTFTRDVYNDWTYSIGNTSSCDALISSSMNVGPITNLSTSNRNDYVACMKLMYSTKSRNVVTAYNNLLSGAAAVSAGTDPNAISQSSILPDNYFINLMENGMIGHLATAMSPNTARSAARVVTSPEYHYYRYNEYDPPTGRTSRSAVDGYQYEPRFEFYRSAVPGNQARNTLEQDEQEDNPEWDYEYASGRLTESELVSGVMYAHGDTDPKEVSEVTRLLRYIDPMFYAKALDVAAIGSSEKVSEHVDGVGMWESFAIRAARIAGRAIYGLTMLPKDVARHADDAKTNVYASRSSRWNNAPNRNASIGGTHTPANAWNSGRPMDVSPHELRFMVLSQSMPSPVATPTNIRRTPVFSGKKPHSEKTLLQRKTTESAAANSKRRSEFLSKKSIDQTDNIDAPRTADRKPLSGRTYWSIHPMETRMSNSDPVDAPFAFFEKEEPPMDAMIAVVEKPSKRGEQTERDVRKSNAIAALDVMWKRISHATFPIVALANHFTQQVEEKSIAMRNIEERYATLRNNVPRTSTEDYLCVTSNDAVQELCTQCAVLGEALDNVVYVLIYSVNRTVILVGGMPIPYESVFGEQQRAPGGSSLSLQDLGLGNNTIQVVFRPFTYDGFSLTHTPVVFFMDYLLPLIGQSKTLFTDAIRFALGGSGTNSTGTLAHYAEFCISCNYDSLDCSQRTSRSLLFSTAVVAIASIAVIFVASKLPFSLSAIAILTATTFALPAILFSTYNTSPMCGVNLILPECLFEDIYSELTGFFQPTIPWPSYLYQSNAPSLRARKSLRSSSSNQTGEFISCSRDRQFIDAYSELVFALEKWAPSFLDFLRHTDEKYVRMLFAIPYFGDPLVRFDYNGPIPEIDDWCFYYNLPSFAVLVVFAPFFPVIGGVLEFVFGLVFAMLLVSILVILISKTLFYTVIGEYARDEYVYSRKDDGDDDGDDEYLDANEDPWSQTVPYGTEMGVMGDEKAQAYDNTNRFTQPPGGYMYSGVRLRKQQSQ